VEAFSKKLHAMGFKVWLAVHYSSTWADPSRQAPPAEWRDIPFAALKDSVFSYTAKIVSRMGPELIQIGNEINPGFLLPQGSIEANSENFRELLSAGARAVRDNSSRSKIIIHYAGFEGAERFLSSIEEIDYDIIGISYYPKWHGKDLGKLKRVLSDLGTRYGKEILIAETAYPFTLKWNDMTHNIVGLKEQLILPEFPATPEGQRAFVERIRDIVSSVEGGVGFCYWGGELIAFKGGSSQNGSPWENQALYDFKSRALPVMKAFRGK
jgi:arabinogalactan endo-1,4-beta-galactosidase